MKKFLQKIIPDRHPLRLFYHKILGFLAALVNGFPGNKMIVIGITGTNGKTTTVNLVTNILSEAGNKVGMASTINFQVNKERWANITKQTTLGPFFLQKLLKRMVNEGCKYAVIEVTSHALTQSRVFGINFDVALFTNITPDHVEYHGGFNNYLSTKGQLFKKVSKGRRKYGVPKILISNKDDKYFGFFDQFVADRKMSFGMGKATVFASNVIKRPEGSKFSLHVPNDKLDIELQMPGEFSIYNALAAASIALSLNIPLEKIKSGLEASVGVPGRFEHVDEGQNFSVIVDYAHTPEALENLLKLYKGLTTGRLFVVFGATGGGRDKGKRPAMGRAADKHADFVIVTDDDPYLEDEWQIIEQVSEGIERKEGESFWKIPDRFEAIRLALNEASDGDCLVIAGKGCEEIIMLKEGAVPWNDKKVVQRILNSELEIDL